MMKKLYPRIRVISSLFRVNIGILFIVLPLYGCLERNNHDADQVEVIKINPNEAKEEINLSEFVDSVKFIKLQTDSGCILGTPQSPLVFSIKEEYIYVYDPGQHSIFVFNKQGKYVSKLDKQGEGPGEYQTMFPFVVDDEEEFIEIFDRGNNEKLKYSNISFKFIEKSPLPEINANACIKEYIKDDSIYYFASQQMKNRVNGKLTNASILVLRNGKIEKTLFDKSIKNEINFYYYPFGKSFIRNDRGEIFATIMWDNTFYRLHNMNADPLLTVDFGKNGFDNSIGEKRMKQQKQYVESTTDLASFPVLNINNSDIIAFSYYVKHEIKAQPRDKYDILGDLYQYIELKNADKIFHTQKINNDITSFPEKVDLSAYYGGNIHNVWQGEFLIDIVTPDKYFSGNETKTEVEGLGQVKFDDNPIIVLMKLK